MNGITDSQQRSYEFRRDEIDRIVVLAMGGALLGGSIYKGIGAVIGGIFGAFVGIARNDEVRKLREKSNE